jgi:hypothetical protein
LPALLVLLASLVASVPAAAGEPLQLTVAEPYLELHEGPGRGYAVFNVVPRGDTFEVLYRRTEWFRVRTRRGVEGWSHQRDLAKALLPDGSPFTFDVGNREGFENHHWELGIATGDYGGASLVGGHLAYSFNPQLQVELDGLQFLGNATNGYALDLGLAHVFEPKWRLSPLVTLGTGMIWIHPKATLVQPPDTRDQTAYAGAGLRFYVKRRFFARAEYRHHMVFTSRNENEEINEWKLTLAFFF